MDETWGCETDSQIEILGKPTITGVVLPNLLLHLGMRTLDSKCWVIMTLIGLNHALEQRNRGWCILSLQLFPVSGTQNQKAIPVQWYLKVDKVGHSR